MASAGSSYQRHECSRRDSTGEVRGQHDEQGGSYKSDRYQKWDGNGGSNINEAYIALCNQPIHDVFFVSGMAIVRCQVI